MPVSSDSPRPSRVFDARQLEYLACPACFGGLQMTVPGGQIDCVGCGRRYPVIDGIPVLIVERGKFEFTAS